MPINLIEQVVVRTVYQCLSSGVETE